VIHGVVVHYLKAGHGNTKSDEREGSKKRPEVVKLLDRFIVGLKHPTRVCSEERSFGIFFAHCVVVLHEREKWSGLRLFNLKADCWRNHL
jgi:hypothetical protein